MGATEEKAFSIFNTPDYKFDGGYYLSPEDKVMVTSELVNYSNNTYTIHSVSEVEYVPGKPEGYMDVVTEVLQVNDCDGGAIGLYAPEGKKQFSFNSKNMTAIVDGYILLGRQYCCAFHV